MRCANVSTTLGESTRAKSSPGRAWPPGGAPTGEFPQVLEHPPAPGLMTFCQFASGTLGNVAAGTQATSAPPPDVKPPTRDITGEAVSELEKALELWRRSWPAHPAYGGSTM